MKKVFLCLVVTFLFAPFAYALQDMQCSNADGSLKRVEEEIWGANPVTWLHKGEEVVGAVEDFADFTKVVLSREESKVKDRLSSVEEVFASRVTVSAVSGDANFRVTDFVICKSRWNDARD